MTVDVVALTVRGPSLAVLLIRRLLEPFKGALALPGGFVLPEESLDQAARREMAEETGLTLPGHLEQLKTYGPGARDPRGPVLSVAHLLLAPSFGPTMAGGDSASVEWTPVAHLGSVAFDHAQIIADGVERARAKLEYSGLGVSFCPPEFTIAGLRAVYEAVWDTAVDPRNFSRKVLGSGIVEPVGTRQGGPGRPAALYRLAQGVDPGATVLNPPIMRP